MKNKLIILAGLLSVSLNAMEPTETKYQSMSPALKSHLQQHAYRELLNPQNENYQVKVIELLQGADLLTGAGVALATPHPGNPYSTTAEDKRIAYDVYTFVANSPAGTINRGLEDWANAGIGYYNDRN